MSRKIEPKAGVNEFPIKLAKDERAGPKIAAKLVSPFNRHGHIAARYSGAILSKVPEEDQATFLDWSLEVKNRALGTRDGDLSLASDILTAQALSLDGIFTELARRAADNMGQYLEASETYMRLALKAQAQSRATLEALAKLHQPREQTVRHVHVNEGGQAIVADQFHNHAGGSANAEAVIQSHGPSSTAAGGTALPSPQPEGQPLPVSRARRPKAVSTARRKSRGAAG